jgi:hypothetical protein
MHYRPERVDGRMTAVKRSLTRLTDRIGGADNPEMLGLAPGRVILSLRRVHYSGKTVGAPVHLST